VAPELCERRVRASKHQLFDQSQLSTIKDVVSNWSSEPSVLADEPVARSTPKPLHTSGGNGERDLESVSCCQG
jgi:hypothetical protein